MAINRGATEKVTDPKHQLTLRLKKLFQDVEIQPKSVFPMKKNNKKT